MVKKDKSPKEAKPSKATLRYYEGIGRRKTAVARVRLTKGGGNVVVNEKRVDAYFPVRRLTETATAPLTRLNVGERFDVSVKLKGGGASAQAGAMRHGLARAIALAEPEFRGRLREEGFLTRDPRMVERKKYGLKKARRAPQWSKR